uniref:Si:ch211-173a9.6 n=1 Tax=Astyanax mexicanus TaxID=7994 RepID=A0A8B9JX90_ASTMX
MYLIISSLKAAGLGEVSHSLWRNSKERMYFLLLLVFFASPPLEDWGSGNVTSSVGESGQCICQVFLPDTTFPADRVESLQISSNNFKGKVEILLQELSNLTIRLEVVESGPDKYIKLDFELLRIELREFEALVTELKVSLNSSSPAFDSLYNEIRNMSMIVDQLESYDRSNLEVIRIEFIVLNLKNMPYLFFSGSCKHEGILRVGKPVVSQLNANLHTGYIYGGWGKDTNPLSGSESMYWYSASTDAVVRYITEYRVVPGASNRFSYHYYPNQILDFASDERGMWVTYATEASKGKLVLGKIDEAAFALSEVWETSIFKQSVTNAFMICGVLYATRSVDTNTEEIFYAYDTQTREENYVSLPFEKFQDSYVSLDYNPTDQKLYMYNSGYYVSYNVKFKSA